MDFISWIHKTYTPIALTSASSEAERLCQKNGLSFSNLLSAFSILEKAETTIRTVAHQFNIVDFHFQFLDITQLAQLPMTRANQYLAEVISNTPPLEICLDQPSVTSIVDVDAALKNIGHDSQPWYIKFRSELLESLRCNESDMFHCPAALILVASSREPNVIQCFQTLGNEQYFPQVFQQGLYDSNLPKFYVLLHDNYEAQDIDPEVILRQMKSIFPPSSCKILRINSLPITHPDTNQYDLWTGHPHYKNPLFPEALQHFAAVHPCLGCVLSSEDIDSLRSFAWDIGLRGILPALESRIFNLNETVSAVKKGMKNIIKSWWRKPKETSRAVTTGQSSSLAYRYDSIESYTRLLADSAFMLQDYDLALSMYRLAREDYRADKAMIHFASSNEMIALCLYLVNGPRSQIASGLESALNTYMQVNTPYAARLATKGTIIASEIYRALSELSPHAGCMSDASSTLIRASTLDNNLCSAVLVERAALCDIQENPPRFRKYAFHLVMAGHMYHMSQQEKHAVRCYSSAKSVYDGQGWSHVEDHINFTLARYLYALGDPASAIKFFLKLIATGRQPAQQQTTFLREFSHVAHSHRETLVAVDDHHQGLAPLVINELCLPEILDDRVKVFMQENACDVGITSFSSLENRENWAILESSMDAEDHIDKAVRRGNMDWFDEPVDNMRYTLRYKKQRESICTSEPRRCIVGEDLIVELTLRNPLTIPIQVEDLQLYGSYGDEELSNLHLPNNPKDHLEVFKQTVTLQPKSEHVCHLKVIPTKVGKLRIIGIKWLLLGEVWGVHKFQLQGELLQDTPEHRATRARKPNLMLHANVAEHMPWLGISISGTPETILSGEVKCFELQLVNKGRAPLSHLRVKSSPGCICIGKSPETDFFSSESIASTIGPSGTLIDLSHIVLPAGGSATLPVWIRGSGSGKQTVRLLFRYNNAEYTHLSFKETRRTCRNVRISFQIDVQPCLNVSAFLRPSFSCTGKYILGLTISNYRCDGSTSHRSITLEKLSIFSKTWTISKFQDEVIVGSCPAEESNNDIYLDECSHQKLLVSPRIGWRESHTIYVVLSRKPSSMENQMSTSVCLNNSSTHGVSELLKMYPIPNFLCLEHAATEIKREESRRREATKQSNGPLAPTLRSIRRANASDKSLIVKKIASAPPSSLENLVRNESEIHLILMWSAESSSRNSSQDLLLIDTSGTHHKSFGQQHVKSFVVQPPLSSRHCPLTITLSYPPEVVLSSTSTIVPIKLNITNGSAVGSLAIDFVLELLQLDADNSGLRGGKVRPHFMWVGCVRRRIEGFASGDSIQVDLCACFSKPGVYDLNRFRFIIDSLLTESAMNNTSTVYLFPTQYLISVMP